MNTFLATAAILLLVNSAFAGLDPVEVKCLVCEKAIDEIEKIVSAVNPDLEIDTGSFRLDASGNIKQKKKPQRQSEMFLSELLEGVCEKMDDYVRATYKTSGKLMLLKLMDETGNMNSDMSLVDIIQDGDLNKSLKYYCEGLMEEHEDAIIKAFKNNEDNIDIKICSMETKYCSSTLPEDDYVHEDL